jgi:hypothetical protein
MMQSDSRAHRDTYSIAPAFEVARKVNVQAGLEPMVVNEKIGRRCSIRKVGVNADTPQ